MQAHRSEILPGDLLFLKKISPQLLEKFLSPHQFTKLLKMELIMKHKILGLALAVLMSACSSTTAVKFPNLTKLIPSQPEESPIVNDEPSIVNKVVAPEWTTIKSGVYHDALGKAVFYGQGLVSKSEISRDRKILSEDRARDELAKTFTSYMGRLVERISTSRSDNSLTDINNDQLRNSIEEGTVTILMEATITNHWLNPDNGKVYSMAELDLRRLTDKLESFNSITMEDRSFLEESIVAAHTSMTNGTVGQVAIAEERIDVKPKFDRLLSY